MSRGQLVGVGVRRAPPPAGASAAPGPCGARPAAGTRWPARRRRPGPAAAATRSAPKTTAPGDQHRPQAVPVADLHEQQREQREQRPEQADGVPGGEQRRRAEAEQRRPGVAGRAGEHHAEPGGAPGGDREPRGVRVQPDARQPPAGGERDQPVRALVGDGDHVPGRPPERGGEDQQRGHRGGAEQHLTAAGRGRWRSPVPRTGRGASTSGSQPHGPRRPAARRVTKYRWR